MKGWGVALAGGGGAAGMASASAEGGLPAPQPHGGADHAAKQGAARGDAVARVHGAGGATSSSGRPPLPSPAKASEAAGLARVRRLMGMAHRSPARGRAPESSADDDEGVSKAPAPFSNSRSRWGLLRKLNTVETNDSTGEVTYKQTAIAHKPKGTVKSVAAMILAAKRMGKDASNFGGPNKPKLKHAAPELKEGAAKANKLQGQASVHERLRQVFPSGRWDNDLQVAEIRAESAMGKRLEKADTTAIAGTTSTFVLRALSSYIKLGAADFGVYVRQGPGNPDFYISPAPAAQQSNGERIRRQRQDSVDSRVSIDSRRSEELEGPKAFQVEWVAPMSGTYTVAVSCCGQPVRGSPFKFAVESGRTMAHTCTCVGSGLEDQVVGSRTGFRITAKDQVHNQRQVGGDNFMVAVSGPGKVRALEVRDNDDGTYDVSYQARTAGKYTIEATLDGVVVQGSPFKVQALIGEAHAPSTILSGEGTSQAPAGEYATFTLQTCDQYGNVITMGGANFVATLMHKRGAILANAGRGETLNEGGGAGQGALSGATSASALAPQSASFRTGSIINTDGSIDFSMLQRRASRQPDKLDVAITDNGDGTYTAKYLVRSSGDYMMRVSLAGVMCTEKWLQIACTSGSTHAMGCKIDGNPPKEVAAGDRVRVCIVAADMYGNLRRVGGDNFVVQVKSSGSAPGGSSGDAAPIESKVVDNGDGSYEVSWEGSVAGTYQTFVLLERKDGREGSGRVCGCPFPTHVTPGAVHVPNCRAAENSDFSATSGVNSYFQLRVMDMFGNVNKKGGVSFAARVEGPGPMTVEFRPAEDGTYNCIYNSSVAGTYRVYVYLPETGEEVAGSPFELVVQPGSVTAARCFGTTEAALAAADEQLAEGQTAHVEDVGEHWDEVIESVLSSMSAGASQGFLLVACDTFGNRAEVAQQCESRGFSVELELVAPAGDVRQAMLGQDCVVSAGTEAARQRAEAEGAGAAETAVTEATSYTAPEAGMRFPAEVEARGNGTYAVSVVPTLAGDYRVHVRLENVPIREPLQAKVRAGEPCGETSLAVGRGCRVARAGLTARFRLIVSDRFFNRVRHGGANIVLGVDKVLANGDDGAGNVGITEGQPPAASLPETPSAHHSDGGLSKKRSSARRSMFKGLLARARSMGARVGRVHKSVQRCTINNNHDGSYTVEWMTPVGGEFCISMQVDGKLVGGTPVALSVLPGATSAAMCVAKLQGDQPAVAGEPLRLLVTACDRFGNRRDTGGDRFSIRLQPVKNFSTMGTGARLSPPMKADVEDHGDGSYTATFVPTAAAEYALHVTFGGGTAVGGEGVAGLGATFHTECLAVVPAAPSAEHSRLRGEGLVRARAGLRATFEVVVCDPFGNPVAEEVPCGPIVGDKGLAVDVVGPGGEREAADAGAHRARSGAPGTFDVYWRPRAAGRHQIVVSVFGEVVGGAPITVEVDAEDVSREGFDAMAGALSAAARGADRAPPTLWDPESLPPQRLGSLSGVSTMRILPTRAAMASAPPLSRTLPTSSMEYEQYVYRKQATILHWGIHKMSQSFPEPPPPKPPVSEADASPKGRHRRLDEPVLSEQHASMPYKTAYLPPPRPMT